MIEEVLGALDHALQEDMRVLDLLPLILREMAVLHIALEAR